MPRSTETRKPRANRSQIKRAVSKKTTRKPIERVSAVPVWRYSVIWVIFGGAFLALFAQAVYLQVIDNEYLQSQGDARYLRVQKDQPNRGKIIDRNGQPLAISTPVDSIWVHPPTILQQKQEYSYKKLSELLGISRDELLRKCESKKTKQFLYLKRHLPPQLANQVMSLDIPGVNSTREYKRYYPAGPVMGHVLGFTNIDNEGQEGLELAYNDVLKGSAGKTRVLQDRYGHVVEYVEQLSPVKHGEDVQLSLDARIQYLAYRHLQAAVKKHKAASASLVALDAKTGEILAMVNAPDFNPNDRGDLASSRFRNRAITDLFEPGSTVKPITVAMAMEAGVIQADTIIDTSPGHLYIGSSRINDTHDYGELTTSNVIMKSSNVGAAKIAMMMQPRDLYNTYASLGFGKTNKLKLQGEQRGILANRKKWRPIEHATMSYGYGLSVNTLQLARSYLALANHGELLPVSLHPVKQKPQGEQVFSKEVADQVKLMMETVVSSKGTASKAKVESYRVAGKTGTAHRVVDGKYQDDSYVSLFAGFAPVSDPDIVIAVVVSDPKGEDYFGGLVAAPVFSSVMSGAMRFRDIVPDAIAPDEEDALKLVIGRPTESVKAHGNEGGAG